MTLRERLAPPPAPAAPRPEGDAAAAPWAPWVLGALVAGLAALVYARTGSFGFVNLDDPHYVVDNPVVRRGLTWDGLRWAFSGFHVGNWHPLTWLSHMADVELFGLDAGRHHLVSAALHVANTVMVLAVLRSLTGATVRSAVVAALFAVHPLHVESVAWIAERKDVLSTLLWLVALLAWGRYARRPSPSRYLAVAFPFVLGLLAKPMVVTLPFTLLLVDLWPLGRAAGDRGKLAALVVEKIPLAAVSVAFAAVTWAAQASAGAPLALGHLPAGTRIANAALSCVAYLGNTVWPAGLASFYPHPVSAGGHIDAWEPAGAILLLAAVTVAAIRVRRRRPYLAWGWSWYLGTLLPVLGLVQVGGQAMADRYTYVPLLGIFVAVVWWVADVARERGLSRAVPAAAALLAVTALVPVAIRQVETWRDSVALHAHAARVVNRNWAAWRGLGDALLAANRPAEAERAYAESIRIFPGLAEGWNGLGASLGALGRPAEAVAPLREAIRLHPRYGLAWINLGAAEAQLGDFPEAVRCLRRGTEESPEDARGWAMLALAALGAGDGALAEEAARRVEAIDPARARELRRRMASARGAP